MPKKKKKHKKKPVSNPKVLRAQHFKDFKKRLFVLAQACQAEKELRTIPKKELEFMFATSFKSFDIVAAEGQKLSKRNYIIAKQIAHFLLKQETITFFEGGPEVTVYEYYYVGEALRAYLDTLKDDWFEGAAELKKALKPFIEKHKAPDGPHMRLFDVCKLMAALLSRTHKGFWLFDFHYIARIKPSPEFRTCYKVKYEPPEIVKIIENGNKRQAYRIGWPEFGQEVNWLHVTPEQINMESPFPDLKIDIYIQSHALRRMRERLDCLSEVIRHDFLFRNIQKWSTVKNSKNQQLVEFTTGKHKLGYLVFEYIQGVVLIKTFLLLTHGSTPEGEQLEKLLKLQKHDRKFLDLDKLSHFINSDIPKNQNLYNQFKAAGCDSLFHVSKQLLGRSVTENIHAKLIEEYINSANLEVGARILV